MSSLILEFTILFLNALNIDFLTILISLNVVGRLLLNLITSVIVDVNEKNVEPDALKQRKFNIFLRLLILVFRFTLEIQIFYPQNLNILFLTLERGIQEFQTKYVLVPADEATINVDVVYVNLLTLMPINCRLSRMRRLLSCVTATKKNMLFSTAKKYMKGLVGIYFGL